MVSSNNNRRCRESGEIVLRPIHECMYTCMHMRIDVMGSAAGVRMAMVLASRARWLHVLLPACMLAH